MEKRKENSIEASGCKASKGLFRLELQEPWLQIERG